jgi:hypothetical protein
MDTILVVGLSQEVVEKVEGFPKVLYDTGLELNPTAGVEVAPPSWWRVRLGGSLSPKFTRSRLRFALRWLIGNKVFHKDRVLQVNLSFARSKMIRGRVIGEFVNLVFRCGELVNILDLCFFNKHVFHFLHKKN